LLLSYPRPRRNTRGSRATGWSSGSPTSKATAFEGDDDTESRRDYLGGFVDDNGINYLVLDGGPPEDFDTVLPEIKNVRGFPIEIFIDRTGAVVETRNSYGYKKSWVKKLTRDLEALLAED